MADWGRRVVWPPGAQRVLRATLDLVASLETLSERGRVVPEPSDPEIRILSLLTSAR